MDWILVTANVVVVVVVEVSEVFGVAATSTVVGRRTGVEASGLGGATELLRDLANGLFNGSRWPAWSLNDPGGVSMVR